MVNSCSFREAEKSLKQTIMSKITYQPLVLSLFKDIFLIISKLKTLSRLSRSLFLTSKKHIHSVLPSVLSTEGIL